MFTPWELVQPRVWHPMASIEQSLMDFDRMPESMLAMPSHVSFHDRSTPDDDDDFFSDLPVRRHGSSQSAPHQQGQQDQAIDRPQRNSSFSGYTYSSSTIVDDKGQRVSSTRRRYEDSTGRLKAVHERQIGDKKLRSVWNKLHKDDQGKHEQTLLGVGDNATTNTKPLEAGMDEFEAAWKATAFGDAKAKEDDGMLRVKEKGEKS